MTDLNFDADINSKSSHTALYQGDSGSCSEDVNRPTRNKSVQWADWELKDVMEFKTVNETTEKLIDEYTQTELDLYDGDDRFPLINTLVQTSEEIRSLASQSSGSSMITCMTLEEDEERQAALTNLITHLEDTTALLRDYLTPLKVDVADSECDSSFEQTSFLLKYQIALVLFTQIVSILLLSLFDHVTERSLDTGYHILTIACGTILQILNMMLVIFATVVLSRQMLKYKVEGSLMAQTYLSTVMTFAGLYFIIYRIQPSSWEVSSTDNIEKSVAIGQFIKMLYLSVSAATLCGASNIQPNSWYATLILCFQSLINFVYFASILAQTIGNYHSYTVQVRRSSSLTRHRTKS